MKTRRSILVTGLLLLAGCMIHGTPIYHEGGPYYYSWAGLYQTPAKPTDEISTDEADKRETTGAAYYIAYFTDDGLLKTLEKRIEGRTFFKFVYNYDQSNVLRTVETINEKGVSTLNHLTNE